MNTEQFLRMDIALLCILKLFSKEMLAYCIIRMSHFLSKSYFRCVTPRPRMPLGYFIWICKTQLLSKGLAGSGVGNTSRL